MGFVELLSLVLAGELPGFRKENDDNGVAHHKHKAGADEGDGQIPEILAGDLDDDRQLKGKLGDHDQKKAHLDDPEQTGDPPELAVPQDGVGLLNFDAVDLEGTHTIRQKLIRRKSLDKKTESEGTYICKYILFMYTLFLDCHSKGKAWEMPIFLS